jgi:hypothetical protein
MRIRRLRKQRRLLLKKIRDLGDRKAQNIFKLEIDKILSKTFIKPAKVLNLFSFRFSFFLNPILLGFLGRIPAESFNS